MHVTDARAWLGTRAGQHASVLFVVKETDGMPIVDFQPGDMNPLHLALCLQVVIKSLVTLEAARVATALDDEEWDGRDADGQVASWGPGRDEPSGG